MPVSLIKQYNALGIDIVQVYGMTENCGLVCALDGADAVARVGSTGKAFFHIDRKIVGEDGSKLPPDTPGELISSGPHNMIGCWNRPEATAETLRYGWLHSGDVATMDAEGYITICDRIKDMIISGGENIYSAEVENVILSHDKVLEVAVIGQKNEQWGEIPLAVVVVQGAIDAQQLLDYCEGKLAHFKIPKRVEFVNEIPRNPTGKALKAQLRERFAAPA